MARNIEAKISNREPVNLVEKLIIVNKVTKVITGGKKLSFAALVVVGDKKGRIGFGTGKAREITDARNKAAEIAKRSMIKVPLKEGRTIHHDVEGNFGAGHVILRYAVPGTGIIAGGPMRAIFECLGIQDIVSKSLGSNNTYNMIYATLNALKNLNSPKMIADRRSKHVSEIIKKRNMLVDPNGLSMSTNNAENTDNVENAENIETETVDSVPNTFNNKNEE